MTDKPATDQTAELAEEAEDSPRLEQTDLLPPASMVGGKYRLGRLLGEGGMGAVYEAEHTGLGVMVAVKLLGESFTTDPKAVTRFRREARAAAAIRHPNIVEVTDTGSDEDGLPFIVMELLKGESLSALLRREKTLPLPAATLIAAQLLCGLGAAHAKGVIHRDLKPGNILLTCAADGACQVKILDFGISKFAAENLPQDVTAAGAVIGTPRFMAPEQALGQPDLDARVDLYAVGVLLYRMVTGRVPFNARTPEGIIQQLLEGKPILPRELRPELPAALEAVILKGMAANRELRFQDAQQFLQALSEALPEAVSGVLRLNIPAGSMEPGQAASSSSISSASYRTSPLVTATSGLQPRLAGTASLQAAARPATAPADPAAGLGRRRGWILLLGLALCALLAGGGYWAARSGLFSRGSSPEENLAGAEWGGSPLRMGITRYLPREQLVKEHYRLILHLSQKLRRPVRLKVLEDYVDLSAQMASGNLELAALSSYNYVRAKRRWPQMHLLATHVTNSGSSYEGFVVARVSSGIRSLKDLEGRIFCYVSPTSTSGYLYPRALIRHQGMDPDRLFKATRFTGDHLAALRALENGGCDGAAVFTGIFFEAAKHGLTPERFTVLATTDRIPYDAYCAAPGLDRRTVELLRAALLSLKPESPLAREILGANSRITGFIRVADEAYDAVRKIEKYLDSPSTAPIPPEDGPALPR